MNILSTEDPVGSVRARFVAGETVVDLSRGEIRGPSGSRHALSVHEVSLLDYLVRNSGRPVSRDELLEHVWGLDPRHTVTRTIDMHVSLVRKKLGDCATARTVLRTVRGVGYQLETGSTFAAAGVHGDGPDMRSTGTCCARRVARLPKDSGDL